MQHEQKDMNAEIAARVAERVEGQDGHFCASVELNENTQVDVYGYVYTDGFRDTDPIFGTGAWQTTGATVSIEDIEVYAYDEEGNDCDPAFTLNAAVIERMLEKHLRAA